MPKSVKIDYSQHYQNYPLSQTYHNICYLALLIVQLRVHQTYLKIKWSSIETHAQSTLPLHCIISTQIHFTVCEVLKFTQKPNEKERKVQATAECAGTWNFVPGATCYYVYAAIYSLISRKIDQRSSCSAAICAVSRMWISPLCGICTFQYVTCQRCFDSFMISAGVCICASRNCVELASRRCLPTHFLNGNKTCVPCSIMPLCSECLFAGGIVCRKCISGFMMANNECTAVPPNCAQPADEVVCARCEDGFALTAQNTCTSCQAVAHCEKCIMRRGVVSCYRCENQLGLTRDRQCEKCDAVLRFDSPQCVCGAAENCGNCDASGTACQECFRGYQKIGGVCVKAKCQVENCFTCSDRPDSCMVCDSDYDLTNRDTCQHRCSGQPQQGSFCKETASRTYEWANCPFKPEEISQMLMPCVCGEENNCANCDFMFQNRCGKCLNGYQEKMGRCVECAAGFAKQESNGICVKVIIPEEVKPGLSAGVIVGIAVAVVVFIGLVVGVVIGVCAVAKRREPAPIAPEIVITAD
ncbi:Cysteine-rich membrane protein 2 [Spironucleus salmonicida]|uniref:Cysteine-rich membrane protein 2 n=1 Tax=Spironucleus salmonicida TaxID=348837 RepID=A0A9P8RZI3_9EUKA|nr:Cysteine-rich membrane protein 2 [Spironucleus salmonicida]